MEPTKISRTAKYIVIDRQTNAKASTMTVFNDLQNKHAIILVASRQNKFLDNNLDEPENRLK